MTEIKQKIKTVMADVFAAEESEIPDDCAFGRFDMWDSMGHMNLVVGLEEKFGIRFSNDEIPGMLSLTLIEPIVAARLRDKNNDAL